MVKYYVIYYFLDMIVVSKRLYLKTTLQINIFTDIYFRKVEENDTFTTSN
jgi:hypothetical protein